MEEAISKTSSRWIQTALLMNYELSELKDIKKKCGDDPEKCCTELFKRWLQKQPAGREWDNLLPILEEVLDSGTFKNIEKAYYDSGMYVKSLVHCVDKPGTHACFLH